MDISLLLVPDLLVYCSFFHQKHEPGESPLARQFMDSGQKFLQPLKPFLAFDLDQVVTMLLARSMPAP
jgi:hypothetical protein